MNVLLCGATGFIGKNTIPFLLQRGHSVFALARKTSDVSFLRKEGVKICFGDVTAPRSLEDAFCRYRPEAVIHCAGFVENRNWRRLYQVNVLGTKNILQLCLNYNVRRVVYLSSVAVISANSRLPLVEELPYSASNMYGASKIEAEKVALSFRQKGLKIAIIRPPMVYGEQEPHALKIIFTLLKYRLFPLLGPAQNHLHLVYVKNLADFICFSLEAEKVYQGSYFVADKEVLTVKKIFFTFAKHAGFKPPFLISPKLQPLLLSLPFAGRRLRFFLKERVYSLDKMLSLGYNPPYNAEEALACTARYFSA